MAKKKTDKADEWIFFAYSFLEIAKIGLKEFKSPRSARRTHYLYKMNILLISILWNFKHSMEIAVKGLTALSEEYYLHTHDQNELLTDLAAMLDRKEIQQPEDIVKFFPLFFKYYRMDIWERKIIKNSFLSDINNDLLRFPHNSARIDIDLEGFSKATKADIKALEQDMKLFEGFLKYFSKNLNTRLATRS